ncbi:MAG: MlaD family protein [Bradymonadia bacterium]
MSESAIKTKVVALILVAAALAVAFGGALGAFDLSEKQRFEVAFADSGALRVGAKVRIAGIEAGRVSDVLFLAEHENPVTKGTYVRLLLDIDVDKAQILRSDAEFHITTRGVLGEKYVEVVPGTATLAKLGPGTVVRGYDPPRIDLFLSKLDRILGQFVKLFGENDGDIKTLVTRLNRLVGRLDEFVGRHGADFGRVIGHANDASADLKKILARLSDGLPTGNDINQTLARVDGVAKSLQRELPSTTRVARLAFGDLRTASQAVSAVAQVLSEQKAALEQALARLPGMTQWAESALQDAASVGRQIVAGQGTIGLLLMNPDIHDEVKTLLTELKRRPWRLMWRD